MNSLHLCSKDDQVIQNTKVAVSLTPSLGTSVTNRRSLLVTQMSMAMANGMVLVMSIWGDHAANML